ncbi:MAG: aminotransferase class V-fold PLP-dependent enzyme [Chitinophagaceae bacterium]|nr:aminotransferase class V-fold PLP-dependent enzyme [Chitinophagaceae bacterium]
MSTYLNTAATGILPAEFTEQANKFYAELSANASSRAEKWRDIEQPLIRQNIADFLGADVGNIALIPNFSWGINAMVHSLTGNEKVLAYAADYPSLLEPFRINGFNITWVKDMDGFTIPVDEIKERLLSEHINILAVSHVQWMSGYKIDLADLGSFCRQHGILFIVDATQSLGAIQINLAELDVDVLIASNYKWMNAGFGTGILYVNSRFFDRYTPAVGGNNSYRIKDGKPVYEPGILSFEPGHPNMYGFTVLNAAINDKSKRGVEHIEQHNRTLTQMLIDGLQDLDVTLIGEADTKNRASIVFLKEENGIWDKLQKHSIVCSQRGNIRISMHYYNTPDDINALLNALK